MTQPTGVPLIHVILQLVMVGIIFYFLLIRPQQTRQKEHRKMLANLKKNDEVITAGGVYGTVVNVKDTTIILRIDENVKIEIQKDSISVIRKSSNS